MNKTIVFEPSSDIRKLARQSLAGSWKTGILAVLLMEIVLQGPTILLALLFPSGALGMVVNLYSILVNGPLALGCTMVFLNICRGKHTSPLEVFYGFEYLFKSVVLQIVIGFFTVMWTMLFIVPGIIATYRYSLSFYILADDPQKGIMQCINESKYLMDGNKGKMFCLDFSFFGWALLCALPVSLGVGFYAFSQAMVLLNSGMTQDQAVLTIQQSAMFHVISLVASVGFLFLTPYIAAAQVCLYDLINGNLTIRRLGPMNQGYHTDPSNPMNGYGEYPGNPINGIDRGASTDGTYHTTTPPPAQEQQNWQQTGQASQNWPQPGTPVSLEKPAEPEAPITLEKPAQPGSEQLEQGEGQNSQDGDNQWGEEKDKKDE